MDNIIANLTDILKFLGYNNENLTENEFNILFNQIIDIYNIKYKQCDEYTTSIIKNSFRPTYRFIYMVPDNLDIIETYKEVITTELSTQEKLTIIKPIVLNNYLTVEQRDKDYEEFILKLKPNLQERERILTEHYDYLKNLPQPTQKSKEWYQMRDNLITASKVADILGDGHFGNRKEAFLEKINVKINGFKENQFVYHGKKYEKIATMIYEHVYNVKIGDFGLIPYQNDSDTNIDYIGCSPDGIQTCITLNGKINPNVGRMLEIKCPLKRIIKTSGDVKGTICPLHYWEQVQIQLATCNNEECDFWQCNIIEYDEEYWNVDTVEEPYECIFTETVAEEQNIRKEILHNITKGVIIQLMPKDKTKVPKGELPQWYAKYIYPSNILMTDSEYEAWIDYIHDNWKKIYPEYVDDYEYDKVLYWKLKSCHNVLIKRDKQWFNSVVGELKLFWDQVLAARNDENIKKKYYDDYMKNKDDIFIFEKPKKSTKKNNSDDFVSTIEQPNIPVAITNKQTKTKPKTKKLTKKDSDDFISEEIKKTNVKPSINSKKNKLLN